MQITSRIHQFLTPPSPWWATPQVLVAPWRNCMWRRVVWEQEELRSVFLGHFFYGDQWPIAGWESFFFGAIFGWLNVRESHQKNGPTVQVKDLYWFIRNCLEIWWSIGNYILQIVPNSFGSQFQTGPTRLPLKASPSTLTRGPRAGSKIDVNAHWIHGTGIVTYIYI